MPNPLIDSNRICYQCKHCKLLNAEPGYSELTPPEGLQFYCSQGHWEFRTYEDGLIELATYLETARNCTDFKLRDDTNYAEPKKEKQITFVKTTRCLVCGEVAKTACTMESDELSLTFPIHKMCFDNLEKHYIVRYKLKAALAKLGFEDVDEAVLFFSGWENVKANQS